MSTDPSRLRKKAGSPPLAAYAERRRPQDIVAHRGFFRSLLEPFSFAFAHGNGFSLLFSRASSPVRVSRRERDLLSPVAGQRLALRQERRRQTGYRAIGANPAGVMRLFLCPIR